MPLNCFTIVYDCWLTLTTWSYVGYFDFIDICAVSSIDFAIHSGQSNKPAFLALLVQGSLLHMWLLPHINTCIWATTKPATTKPDCVFFVAVPHQFSWDVQRQVLQTKLTQKYQQPDKHATHQNGKNGHWHQYMLESCFIFLVLKDHELYVNYIYK